MYVSVEQISDVSHMSGLTYQAHVENLTESNSIVFDVYLT